MKLDQVALILVIAGAAVWLVTLVTGMMQFMPYGMLILVPLALVAGLLVRIIGQRMNNKEDDYYDKNIEK